MLILLKVRSITAVLTLALSTLSSTYIFTKAKKDSEKLIIGKYNLEKNGRGLKKIDFKKLNKTERRMEITVRNKTLVIKR